MSPQWFNVVIFSQDEQQLVPSAEATRQSFFLARLASFARPVNQLWPAVPEASLTVKPCQIYIQKGPLDCLFGQPGYSLCSFWFSVLSMARTEKPSLWANTLDFSCRCRLLVMSLNRGDIAYHPVSRFSVTARANGASPFLAHLPVPAPCR